MRDRPAEAKGQGRPDDWVAVGTVVGAFGLHGDLKLQPLTDFPERFGRTPTLYVGAAHAPRTVTSARLHGRLVVAHLEGVESATEAEKLRGQRLFIPAGELLALPADHYYLHDLIGLRVEDVDGAPLGVIADVITGSGNDLFVVRRASGGDALLPAVKAFVKSVDVPGGVVRVAPIPGLFDDKAVEAEPTEGTEADDAPAD